MESLGGFISSRGGAPRVNGILVSSRSIGDAHLKQFLTQKPHVIAMTKDEMRSKCQKVQKNPIAADSLSSMPCFIVLASDGLWDVMSNQEAVDMVEFVIQKYDPNKENGWKEGVAFQEAAEMLTKVIITLYSYPNILFSIDRKSDECKFYNLNQRRLTFGVVQTTLEFVLSQLNDLFDISHLNT